MISLAGGLPDASRFPTTELASLAHEVIATDGPTVLQYAPTEGVDRCRRALARHFGLGDWSKVLITTGSQQGLHLIARALLEPGDQVVTSDPEYVGLLQVLRANGLQPVPVPTDGDGLDTEALSRRLATGWRPAACYLVPHHHNPSGVTMSLRRRRHLNQLAATYGFLVIEDDPYRDLYFDRRPPEDVEAVDPTWLIRLRSTSKSLAPGLRVGVVQASTDRLERLVLAKQSVDLHTSSLTQELAARAVDAPWFEAHGQELRRVYAAKARRLVAGLEVTFGSGPDRPADADADEPPRPGEPPVSITVPTGGMFVWAHFAGLDTNEWLERALDCGVCFVPGSAFAVEADLRGHARFSFATATLDEIDEAVARLARSMPARVPQAAGR
jgi:2-aminoadipate transaminase